MIGIFPDRVVARQRLLIGTIIVAATSLLNLIPLEFGILGSPWPVGLLWAICGWSGLGPNLTTATLLFFLGLWVDILTAATLGTWAFIALSTHAATLVTAQYLGTNGLGRIGSIAVSGTIMLLIMTVFQLWRGSNFFFVGTILTIVSAIGLYHYVGFIFELCEDEL